jgi:protein TonB
MSLPALVLAVLLHALVALALWRLSQDRPPPPPAMEPIEITIEKPKPAEPPPPPAPQQSPPPAPPIISDLRPPAPIISDKPTQVPTPDTQTREIAPPQTARVIEPQPEPPKPEPPKPEPPKPQPPKPAPQGHGLVIPPANPLPRPSPLTQRQQRQAARTPGPDEPAPSPFVNPADAYNRARVRDNYLWEVVRKLRGYQYHANVAVSEGITVVKIVIARDGRLLDAEVVSSSGQPEMDRGVLAGVRAGAPYSPLPPNIQGESAAFTLPLISVRNR